MKKIILTYGAHSGLIAAIFMILSISIGGGGLTTGYAAIIAGLSMIFFGVKAYRNSKPDGRLTFGQAFKVGLGITLLASLLYVVGWEIYSAVAMPNFMEHYTTQTLEKMNKDGATQEQIDAQRAEMQDWGEKYKNPLFRYMMVMMEILPVGIVVSLITAGILRRKEPPIPVA